MFLGVFLGLFTPAYYRAVFDDPRIDALQVGTGLGLTQGLGAGVVIGILIVAIVGWSHRRRAV
jgi:hypothetical protein